GNRQEGGQNRRFLRLQCHQDRVGKPADEPPEMTRENPLRESNRAATLEEAVSPFLPDRKTVLYNPLTGGSVPKDGEAFRTLSRIEQGLSLAADPAVLEHLRAARFLIEDVDREARRSHLLYLSLETCTSCNHRCPFCPVSVDPREREVMSQE